MKQAIKRLLFPQGRHLRKLRGGIAKGMWMELDLAHQSQRYFGVDERELLGALPRLIADAKSLVDVGANDGFYTMAFLRSRAARVVACEPGPAAEQLVANAKANGYEPGARFVVERRCVGPHDDEVSITELLKELPQPVFLKVDIDGGEFDLLQSGGNCGFLNCLRWLIETHSPELEAQCIAWLEAHGYETRIIRNAWWRAILPEQRPLAHNRWLVAEPLK
jgi:hypothetical protein